MHRCDTTHTSVSTNGFAQMSKKNVPQKAGLRASRDAPALRSLRFQASVRGHRTDAACAHTAYTGENRAKIAQMCPQSVTQGCGVGTARWHEQSKGVGQPEIFEAGVN